MSGRQRALVLCTGNSCRSQMAEGWINRQLGDSWEAYSAGVTPADSVNPLAIRAMSEIGIDISAGKPELVNAYLDQQWDLVITVCDSARESCPVFPRPMDKLHLSFPDPAGAEGSGEERMVGFRRVRDAIREKLLPEVARRG
jgi:arsenate reductase